MLERHPILGEDDERRSCWIRGRHRWRCGSDPTAGELRPRAPERSVDPMSWGRHAVVGVGDVVTEGFDPGSGDDGLPRPPARPPQRRRLRARRAGAPSVRRDRELQLHDGAWPPRQPIGGGGHLGADDRGDRGSAAANIASICRVSGGPARSAASIRRSARSSVLPGEAVTQDRQGLRAMAPCRHWR